MTVLALDCEMVGVMEKSQYTTVHIRSGEPSFLARVSIVNENGVCIYDKFVKPNQPVTNYRTQTSGIRPEDIEKGDNFEKVKKEVVEIVRNKTIVGHSIQYDLASLKIVPEELNLEIRDTAWYPLFHFEGKISGLKSLVEKHFGASAFPEFQAGEHSSIKDAEAAMKLYQKFKTQWESDAPLLRKVEMQIPSSKQGYVIGKKGSKIQEIIRKSGAIVILDGDILTIVGCLDASEKAKKMVQDIISRF